MGTGGWGLGGGEDVADKQPRSNAANHYGVRGCGVVMAIVRLWEILALLQLFQLQPNQVIIQTPSQFLLLFNGGGDLGTEPFYLVFLGGEFGDVAAE